MLSLLQHYNNFFSQKKRVSSLGASQLQDHDETGKQEALDAVDILIRYKSTVHEFTDEIVSFWPLPQKVMDRYHFDDAEQLNEWLDDLS